MDAIIKLPVLKLTSYIGTHLVAFIKKNRAIFFALRRKIEFSHIFIEPSGNFQNAGSFSSHLQQTRQKCDDQLREEPLPWWSTRREPSIRHEQPLQADCSFHCLHWLWDLCPIPDHPSPASQEVNLYALL